MKKCIGILAVFFISGVVTLYGKKITHLISEKPENKTVSFLYTQVLTTPAPFIKRLKQRLS